MGVPKISKAYIVLIVTRGGRVTSFKNVSITSFTSTNVKFRLRFDVHLTFNGGDHKCRDGRGHGSWQGPRQGRRALLLTFI